MSTTVVKLIGTGGDFTSLTTGWTDWEAAKPTDYTTARTNTVAALSSSSTIQLDASASATTDFYVGHTVLWNSQTRLITAYNGTTKIATIGVYRNPATEVASNATWDTGTPTIGDAFVVDSVVWSGRALNFEVVTATFTIAGSTNNSTSFSEITTAIGASFIDNASVQSNALRYNAANGAAIKTNSNYSVALDIGENNCHVSKMQFAATGGQTVAANIPTSATVDKCILEASPGANSSFNRCIVNNGLLKNSLVVDRSGSARNGIIFGGPGELRNVAIVKPSDLTAGSVGIARNYTSGAIVSNCAVFGYTTALNNTTSISSFTCFTDQASPPSGWATTAYSTSSGAKFQNITDATRDYRIQSGSSFIDAGTTDSANVPNDIVNTSRPQGAAYDVGPWEYIAAAPANKTNFFLGL